MVRSGMAARALVTSPLARLLLDLHDRRVDGSLEIGGRRIALRAGDVAEVGAGPGDESLAEYLVRAGRIDRAHLAELSADGGGAGGGARDGVGTVEEDAALAAAVLARGLLSASVLGDARRGLAVERLANALAAHEEAEADLPTLVPLAAASHGDTTALPLVPLLLDALARIAASGDAEQVGLRVDHHFEALAVPHAGRGLRWAGLDQTPGRQEVATLLSRAPAAAPKIAALIRAGMARLLEPAAVDAPPPPPRPTSLLPTASGAASTKSATHAGGGDERGTSPPSVLPPARAPELLLDPGAAPVPDLPVDLATPLRAFPPVATPLEDPLDAVEAEIGRLELAGASGEVRAAAWKQAARLWQTRFGSVEEAARCYREAAAADPTDRAALEQAALLCAALGRPALAAAYGRAASALCPEGEARELALLRLAVWCERAGDGAGALAALRSAVAGPLVGLGVVELLVARLTALGEHQEAVELAREAAARAAEAEPVRARALLADALGIAPGDPSLAEALAASLEREGLREAALLVLLDTARAASAPEVARALRLRAAELAEQWDRPELAAEALQEAWDAEPTLEALLEPLCADLEAAGQLAELAVLCEDAAAVAEDDRSRAAWLARAARRHAALPGGAEPAVDLAVRAAELDPDADEVEAALREALAAARDPTLASDALLRVAAAALGRGATSTRAHLEALARHEADRLDGARRELWARAHLAALGAHPTDPLEPVAAKVRLLDGMLEAAERELEGATSGREATLRRVASLLRDHPERRADALPKYRELLDLAPTDTAVAAAAERAAWAAADDDALADILAARLVRARAETSTAPSEIARLASRLAALSYRRGDDARCVALLRDALTTGAAGRDVVARLARAAARGGDLQSLAVAHEHRARLAVDGRSRGRALAALARVRSALADARGALEAAEQALSADPRAADAAAVVVAQQTWLPPERAATVLELVRAVLGESPALLDALFRAARAAGDRERASAALDAWLRFAPTAPRPALERLRLRTDAHDPRQILAAVPNTLAPEAITDETVPALLAAMDRLAALGAVDEAVDVGLHALDRLGATEAALCVRTVELARASGDHALRVAALERWVGAHEGKARLAPLAALAAEHRSVGDDAAEARAHLRTLAVSLYDPHALSRLQDLYGAHGEADRLLAVLTLRLESARTAEARREVLLDMAAAAAQVAGDTARAEGFLDTLLQECAGDDAWTDRAIGALVTIGRPLSAIERLLALAASAPEARARVLCERAVAIAEREAHDDALAMRTAAHTLEIVPSHAPLLLVFERLALALGEVSLAKRVYERLIAAAMGSMARRALSYRAARFFERVGDQNAALEAYERAFEHDPSAGVIFRSIERLAEATGNLEPVAKALSTLADRARSTDGRVALLLRRADLLEHRMASPRGAFEAVRAAWESGGGRELEARMRSLIARMRTEAPSDAAEAAAELEAGLRGRADGAWDAEERAGWLVRAARVHAEGTGDPDRARSLLAEAEAAAAEASFEDGARVAYLCDRAEALAALGDLEDARAAVGMALSLLPSEPRALEIAHRLGVDRASVPRGLAEAPSPRLTAESEGTAHSPVACVPPRPATLRSFPPPLADGSAAPSVPRAPQGPAAPDATESVSVPAAVEGPAPSTGPDEVQETTPAAPEVACAGPVGVVGDAPLPIDRVIAHMESGDLDAAEALALRLAERDGPGLHDVASVLRGMVRREPWRTRALRALRTLALRRGARAEAAVTAALVGTFDPSMPVPVLPLVDGALGPDFVRGEAVDPDHAAFGRILARAWEGGLSLLFRKSLQQYRTVGTDRVAAYGNSPVARAYAAAARALDATGTPLYLRPFGTAELLVATTSPPCLVGGSGLDGPEAVLRFRIGRALELARPENVLVAALSPADARAAIEATVAAFGPADGGPVSREAAALAAELWRTVPAPVQRELREEIVGLRSPMTGEAVTAAAMAAGARAGLVAAGDLGAAIRALRIDDEEVAASEFADEGGFAAAARRSAGLAAIVRSALSDQFLAAVARALG
jgi:tetratricopeptide (TPR) repeat protein